MISSVTDLSVPELDRPRSCDSSLDRKATGQILTCCASLDGSQCKICRSLISLSNSSQFNDSQSFSPKMKRDASSSLYSGVFSHALDPLVSPPASRGNTLKTLRSLTEEAEDGSLNSTDIYKDNDVNCMKKIVINRNVTENNLLCFPEDLPNEFYLCKEAFVTEEMWSSFIKQLNGIFFKISSFSEGHLTCCFTSKYKKRKQTLEKFIKYSNEKTFNPCGLQIKVSDTETFAALEVTAMTINRDSSKFRIDTRIFDFPH